MIWAAAFLFFSGGFHVAAAFIDISEGDDIAAVADALWAAFSITVGVVSMCSYV